MFEKSVFQWRHAEMDEFDVRGHARLVGNVLIAVALIAFGIALVGLLPNEIFKLRPHFFGNEGAAFVGVVFLVAGILLRR